MYNQNEYIDLNSLKNIGDTKTLIDAIDYEYDENNNLRTEWHTLTDYFNTSKPIKLKYDSNYDGKFKKCFKYYTFPDTIVITRDHYNDKNNLVFRTDSIIDNTNGHVDYIINDYKYNIFNNLVKIKTAKTSDSDFNTQKIVSKESCKYNIHNQKTFHKYVDTSDSEIITVYKTFYEYDKNGNLIKEYDKSSYITTYEYDCDNRLIKKTYKEAFREFYDLGFVINKTTTYKYDNKGNMISSIEVSDLIEPDISTIVFYFIYDCVLVRRKPKSKYLFVKGMGYDELKEYIKNNYDRVTRTTEVERDYDTNNNVVCERWYMTQTTEEIRTGK